MARKLPAIPFSEQASFWGLPIASVEAMAEVMGMTADEVTQAFPTYKIGVGNGLWVRPIEVAHSFRGIRPEAEAGK
jgi:hypothetical protein